MQKVAEIGTNRAMEVDLVGITLISAVASAAVLLIATLGLAVVFGLMGVINLAHGEFIMLGAYAALLSTRAGLPFWAAIVVAVILTAAFGAMVEVLLIRRLYSRILDTMLATWGLSLVLYQAAVVVFGAVTPGLGFSFPSVNIGAYGISAYLLALIAVAALLTAALYLLLTRTSYGVLARAAVQDPQMSAAIGIDAARINTATFALGCGLAGFAGAVLLPIVPATPGMGFAFVVKAFLGVVIAGPLALSGTVMAIGVLGALSNITASVWSAVFGDLLFFGATIALLWVFPQGISQRWRMKL
jgi:urea transport system permease protein